MNTFKEHVAATLRSLADQVEEESIICYLWNATNKADEYAGDVTDIIIKAKFNIAPDYISDEWYDNDGDDGASVVQKLHDLLKNKEVEVNGD